MGEISGLRQGRAGEPAGATRLSLLGWVLILDSLNSILVDAITCANEEYGHIVALEVIRIRFDICR